MYDFDKVIQRKGTDSLKWDEPDIGDNVLPMWVADMDFETAPEIKDAIIKRASHGVFGYSIVPDRWNEAIASWWKRRYSHTINKDHLIFCTGIVPAISSIVRKFTTPNENVVIMTPVCNIFFNSIKNNGARVLESPLVYSDGRYEIDFKDLESKLSDPQTSLMLLCNPQNPGGRIWSASELQRIGDLCRKYDVTVVSDEIHCDLTDPGLTYTPFASVSETCRDISITCIAPTKTFNIAGIQTAAVYADNRSLRHRVWRALNTDEVAEPNAFAMDATIAAYEHGEEWLEAVLRYLERNLDFAVNYVNNEIPYARTARNEGTYLLWINLRDSRWSDEELERIIVDRAKLWLDGGRMFGAAGHGFQRINFACPHLYLVQGLKRLREAIVDAAVVRN